MMRAGHPRQRFRSALLEKPLDPEPLRANPLEVEVGRARAGDDDEVDPRGYQPRMGSEAFTAEPLDPVSLDRAPDPATHDQPEPGRAGLSLGCQEEGEVGGPHAPRGAIGLGPRELRVLTESAVGAEGHHLARRPRDRADVPAYFL
jgi:hypothetical protein